LVRAEFLPEVLWTAPRNRENRRVSAEYHLCADCGKLDMFIGHSEEGGRKKCILGRIATATGGATVGSYRAQLWSEDRVIDETTSDSLGRFALAWQSHLVGPVYVRIYTPSGHMAGEARIKADESAFPAEPGFAG
jgi:hypothetical protein